MGIVKRVVSAVKDTVGGTAKAVTGAVGTAKHNIETENPDSVLGDLAGTAKDTARSVSRRVTRNAAGAKVDWAALSDAALEGSGLRNRKGEFKAWRVAKSALWPVAMLKDAGTELAKEALRQRSSLKDLALELGKGLPEDPAHADAEAADGAAAGAMSEEFFARIIDDIVVETGAPDGEELRETLLQRLIVDGLDNAAESLLSDDDLDVYVAEAEAAQYAAPSVAATLLRLAPQAYDAIIEALEAARDRAIEWVWSVLADLSGDDVSAEG